MTQAKQLKELYEYAHDLKEVLEDLSNPPAGDEEKELRQRALMQSQNLEKTITSPVKIGIVGEFSAGKSFLLGALFGYADLLPVDEIPTTGNVTRLHFHQHEEKARDPLKPTQIQHYTIEYISELGAKETLAFMLEELEDRASSSELQPTQIDALKQLRLKSPLSSNAVQEWCKEAWEHSTNPKLRTLIRETIIFLRAYSQCAALLGRRYEVTEETAKSGLTLKLSGGSLAQDSFHSIPPPPAKLDAAPGSLTPSLISNTFPLIRCCDITIHVSKKIWNLSPIKTQSDFILLDFPGLGAETSGVRDAYLCMRELEDVQTILILLNAKQPGAGEAQQIFNLMQKHHKDLQDRILVGISRFNQLPINPNGWSQIESLLSLSGTDTLEDEDEEDALGLFESSPPPSNLRESDLYTHLPTLGQLISSAKALTARTDRVVFLSPPLYFHHLKQNHPTLPLASSKYTRELEKAIESSLAQQKNFYPVVEALKASGVAEQLTTWLEQAYADDGGVFALRELFQRHVAEHGLQQIFEQGLKKATELHQTIQRLCHLLAKEQQTHPVGQQEQDLYQNQEHIGKLLQTLFQLDARYKNTPRDFFSDETKKRQTLSELIEEEITTRFYQWPLWQQMLRSVSEDGFLKVASEGKKRSGLLDLDDDETENLAKTSEDFLHYFVQECQQLGAWLQPHIENSLRMWLEEITVEVAPHKKNFRELLKESQNAGGYPRSSQKILHALKLLFSIESRLPQLLEAVSEETSNQDDASRWERVFPLNLHQKFAWHPAVSEYCHSSNRHQSTVIRIREELIASALRELNEQLGQAQITAKQTMSDTFKQLTSTIGQLRSDKSLLQRFSPPPPSTTETPDGFSELPLLAKLRAVRNPVEQNL